MFPFGAAAWTGADSHPSGDSVPITSIDLAEPSIEFELLIADDQRIVDTREECCRHRADSADCREANARVRGDVRDVEGVACEFVGSRVDELLYKDGPLPGIRTDVEHGPETNKQSQRDQGKTQGSMCPRGFTQGNDPDDGGGRYPAPIVKKKSA